MGKTKDRLNNHNVDLLAILSDIKDLPPAGGEDLQSTAEEQTATVASLMAMVKRKVSENRGEGEYVWKKYEFYNITAEEISYSPVVFKVSAEVGDLSKVDETFFDGWTLTRSTGAYHILYGDGTARRVGSTGTASNVAWSYNPNNQTINIDYSWGSASTATTVQYNIPQEYISFAVSDDSMAYPNGGKKDGYWYEPYYGGDNATKIVDCGEVTIPTGTTAPLVIEHSLDAVPSFAALMSTPLKLRGSTYGTININGYNYRDVSGFTAFEVTVNKTDKTVEFYLNGSETSYNFPGGTYKWFVVK